MKKYTRKILASFFILAGGILFVSSCGQEKQAEVPPPERQIEDTVLAQVNAFYTFLRDTLQPAAASGETSPDDLQQYFLKARLLFKKFEWAAEYFMGATTLMVNGPPVEEVENADLLDPALTRPIEPSGLQVIEEFLFPRYDTTKKEAFLEQLGLLQENCRFYQTYFTDHPLSGWRILDAAKIEVFRVMTLGITGFDNPLTLNSMQESATALTSLKNVLAFYTSQRDPELIRLLDAAVDYLQKNTDFDLFNRAAFITVYGNKITTGITSLTRQLNMPDIRYNRLLSQDAKTLFDSGAFNVNAFAPGPAYYTTPEKVALGKRLFYDAGISGSGTRSCASCHQPDKAFTDGMAKNFSLQGKTPLERNTPTLVNAALQSNLFYDMRALTLEDQVHDVIQNKAEMDGSLKKTVTRLRQNKRYRDMFAAAFPEKGKPAIDTFEVMNALSAYVRSLTKLNSRFDEYMRGDPKALSAEEINGFNLFAGKAKCATCHYIPLFNGVVPPKYIKSDAEVIGVPAAAGGAVPDPDPGWYGIIGVDSYRQAFKTPTVRNISKTAPYMHNGIYTDLEQVMDFYNRGGGAGMGLKINNQTLPEDSLHLTVKETGEIIAFMKSLDSR